MSEDMAVDSATGAKMSDQEAAAHPVDSEASNEEPPIKMVPQQLAETTPSTQDVKEETPEDIESLAVKSASKPIESSVKVEIPKLDDEEEDKITKIESTDRGVKRRASEAFSDTGEQADDASVPEEFKGFESVDGMDTSKDSRLSKVLERLEAEVVEAVKQVTPVKTVTAIVAARASKRFRQDTDGSRPSSALSSRSDGESALSNEGVSSPAYRGGGGGARRATVEMSSPLLRVPLERGWRRELVYRAQLDHNQRRNADIYYYTPAGKKLRSTREVAEHLSGTGLTIENFSFFKEPLGIDDPEKEIIRDAKLMRKSEAPVVAVAAPVLDGKRTPKPKAPKGASPEYTGPKSPPAKIKVKSVGSRLSGRASPAPAQKAATPAPASTAAGKKPAGDNNNTQPWKKPRQGAPTQSAPAGPPAPPAQPAPSAPPALPAPPAPPERAVTPPPPPLQCRPPPQTAPIVQSPQQLVQPCSLTCGRGVPSLACAACLCLYHPACAGHAGPHTDTFYCKNCRKSSSPPREPPPLLHKSCAAPAGPAPRPAAPAPAPANTKNDKRVLLRMKVAGGGPDGERVWAVAKAPPAPRPAPPPAPRAPAPAPAPAHAAPQALAFINGRRFVIVPRTPVPPPPPQPPAPARHEERRGRGRVSNGVAETPPPRRRVRTRPDDTDHFTAFINTANQLNYNVVVQIFQYVGMRELAVCARVCRLWRTLAATPALWRHVRMKNSHVSDWGGLCAALKRHGTVRLDLRKMLLPQNDAVFWQHFAQHIPTVDTLERIELCRCPASAVEAVCRGLPALRSLSALAIRDALLDPAPLGALTHLHELRLKSMNGLSLTRDLRPLAALTKLTHLSLTSIKELGWCASDIIGKLDQLESLELGECTFRAEFASVLARLVRLRRLRLERGTAQCAAPHLLRALATLPHLTRLELVNIDVKVGFDDALAECRNIQRLLIIPTYVSQSATTNKQVLSGVLRLKDTLTHLMWGVTIELLRVTELFIDQCEQAGEPPRRDLGECIPVLKPVPGCRLPDHTPVHGPPQVEILPLPTLQRLLSAQLPHTRLKLLRIPFHATWRQTLQDFQ